MSTAENAASEAEAHVMLGQGFYNAHSQQQRAANELALPQVERAFAALTLPEDDRPCWIADYGSSQGANSLKPMGTAIAALRKRTSAPVNVIHVDLPGNDFSALFALVRDAPDSYLKATDVYSFASGHSFYEDCFPAHSVLFGYSAIAVHWMSQIPCPVPNGIWPMTAVPEVRRAYAAQSAADWRDFLACRGREMRPGAQLLVVIGAGYEADGTSGAEGLVEVADEALRRLVSEGLLSPPEYERMHLGMYFRTPDEWRAPFENGTGPGGLELIEDDYRDFEDVLYAQFKQTGDRETYAIEYREFLRAFAERPLFAALDEERTPEHRARAIARWTEVLRELILADPERVVCKWRLGFIRMRRP